MTDPEHTTLDVPLRVDRTFEVPGTPEQVWEAIATANGLSAWFLPTDVDERHGGTLVTHMGELDAPATITGWDPPRRFAYEEDWAVLAGRSQSAVTPMATEFLVEARSGGTCVVRVVSSAFGTGADWEQEFFDDMEKHWTPFFDNLQLYLTRFPGQLGTSFEANAKLAAKADQVHAAMRQSLGITDVGQHVEFRSYQGEVKRIAAPTMLVSVTEPAPGFVQFWAWDDDKGAAAAQVRGYLYSDDAAAVAEREQPAWTKWLSSLGIKPAASAEGAAP